MTTTKLMVGIAILLAGFTAVAILWQPKPPTDGKTPIVWVSDNNPARSDQIEQFNREYPGLHLNLDYGNNGVQKIVLQCNSGVGPEVMDFQETEMQTLVAAGVLMDLTDAAKQGDFSAEKDSWPTAAQSMVLDGRQYGYPCNTGALILIYNKNIFDKFGVPYPEGTLTYDEFLALALKLDTYASGQTKPGSQGIHAISGMNWRTFFEAQHGEFFSDQGRPVIADSPQLKRAFQLHKDYVYKYRVMPTTVELNAMGGQGGWGSGNLNQFASGNFAMVVTGNWALNAFGRAHQQQVKNLEASGLKEEDIKDPAERPLRLGAVLLPKFADLPPSYGITTRLAGINQHSPRRQEALSFLHYLAGPTYSTSINQASDFLPGNPKYADLGVEPGPPSLASVQMHDMTKQAVTFGYTLQRSPFILSNDVIRVMDEQISRMESDPNLSVDELLQSAQNDMDTLLRRNLDRDPKLKALYEQRFGANSLPSR